MKLDFERIFPWRRRSKESKKDSFAQVEELSAVAKHDKKNKSLSPLQMRQAVLLWLAKQKPTGIGINVPTRFSRFQADVAAFWSKPVRKKIYAPTKTAVIEIRLKREDCWPDIAKQQVLLTKLIELKEHKRKLEEIIQMEEPELRESDGLFSEFECWQYKKSKNKKYHKCLRDIERIEHAIYKGSRFEQIRRAHVADNLYIAVPENLIHPDELADGWGLLYVSNDLKVKTIKSPDDKECSNENRLHLAQTISASATKYVLYSQGINISTKGEFFITAPPHRRYKTIDRPAVE